MEWIDNVLRDVAELPDRNSPEDWPEAMLVTGDELRQIIVTHAPAEPVNARLLDVATGKIPHLYEGRCPDYVNGPESRDPDCPACQAIAEAEAQQERLLQDMHDAGREIDRVMAEAAPKAVRLTLDELDAAAKEGGKTNWVTLFQRIETAVLRKNGIEVRRVVLRMLRGENGAIRKGDLLSAATPPGHAMRAGDAAPGTTIGKALEDFDGSTGLIDVFVFLR